MNLPPQINEFIKRDALYIVCIIFALAACAWTIASMNDYRNDINTYWEQELTRLGCYGYNIYTENFSLINPMENDKVKIVEITGAGQ